MRVRDLMTRNVFTVRSDKTLIIVDEIMSWARVRHVPVVDAKNRLVGLISHRDLMRASISSVEPASRTWSVDSTSGRFRSAT